MKYSVRWMLLGIFLGVAAVWCLLAGSGGSTVLAALGFYLLPIMALVCFLTGFCGQGEPRADESHSENPDVPRDTEDKE